MDMQTAQLLSNTSCMRKMNWRVRCLKLCLTSMQTAWLYNMYSMRIK